MQWQHICVVLGTCYIQHICFGYPSFLLTFFLTGAEPQRERRASRRIGRRCSRWMGRTTSKCCAFVTTKCALVKRFSFEKWAWWRATLEACWFWVFLVSWFLSFRPFIWTLFFKALAVCTNEEIILHCSRGLLFCFRVTPITASTPFIAGLVGPQPPRSGGKLDVSRDEVDPLSNGRRQGHDELQPPRKPRLLCLSPSSKPCQSCKWEYNHCQWWWW